MAGTHIIDQRDNLGGSFTASLLVHAVVFAAAAGWTWYAQTHRDAFGDPNSAGGVTVVATEGIPIIQRTGPVNPVANDTESQVPDRPKPAARPKEVEDPDSIGITRTPKKKKKELTAFEKRIQETSGAWRRRICRPTRCTAPRAGRRCHRCSAKARPAPAAW
ncbi:MAG: hypothetical protein SFV51_27065 [Bryobacteraceae bacterium]|nr:hypothetical protein [Bryobacteraceae bacterium]